jgi:Neuraminidase (sialidase)
MAGPEPPGESSKRKGHPDSMPRRRKRKQIDYAEIASQVATSSQVDPLSQIRRHESLDSYARLQSLMSSALYSLFSSTSIYK